MKNVALFFILILIWGAGASAQNSLTAEDIIAKAHKAQLSESTQWRKLLHFQQSIFGRWESQADGPAFFIAPQGKQDASAELDADIHAFFSKDVRNLEALKRKLQTAYCQLPARRRYIESSLQVHFPEQACEGLDEWRNRVRAKSVTLVFSSYYLNNPSSVFGHSLIRLNKRRELSATSSPSLLDYGVNYAAVANTSNPLLYALYGFAGGFPGEFSAIPYYYKVREYNDYDSRDLWEYDLNFTEEEVSLLVDHIWELGSTYFDYFYITENCSYHMLTLFEAVSPRLDLVSHLPPWVIPSDTLKAIYANPGFVRGVRFRPSSRRQFYQRMNLLKGPEEAAEVRTLTGSRVVSDQFSKLAPESQARVLDATVDYIDYRYPGMLMGEHQEEAKWKQSLLVKRSQLPVADTPPIEEPAGENPSSGHGTFRLGVGGGSSEFDGNTRGFLDLNLRFSLHDFLDRSEGFPTYAKIGFGEFKWRVLTDHDRQVYLKTFNVLDVESLNPMRKFERNFAWRLNFGYEKRNELGCLLCEMSFLKTGMGLSVDLMENDSFSVFAIAGLTALGSTQFSEGWARVGIGPVAGFKYRLSDRFAMYTEWSEYHFLTQTQHTSVAVKGQIRYAVTDSLSVDLSAQKASFSENENAVNFFWYF